ALDHLEVDADAIAWVEGGQTLLQLTTLDAVDHAAHRLSMREKTAGARSERRAVGEWYLLGAGFEILGPRAALLDPPGTDLLLVAGEQDLGNRPAPVDRRAGVVGVLGHPLEDPAERLLGRRVLMAQSAGELAHDDVGDDHRRQLAAGEDVTAD